MNYGSLTDSLVARNRAPGVDVGPVCHIFGIEKVVSPAGFEPATY